MTREDIGNYLGAKLETVSRVFSRFQQRGLIHLSPNKREVIVLDIEGLRAMLPQEPSSDSLRRANAAKRATLPTGQASSKEWQPRPTLVV